MSFQENCSRVIIAGGGTAGHVHAGISIAKQLKNAKVLFVGTKRGMESFIVPKYGYDIKYILARGLKRENIFVLLVSILFIPIAFLQSFFILLSTRPQKIIGVGGYASWSVVILGKLFFIDTYVLEQNKVIGFTNKILLPFVKKIFVSFPDTAKIPNKYKTKEILSGCPIIKQNIQYKKSDTAFRIFIFGGSQGAYAINKVFIDSIPLLNELNSHHPIKLVHQTGKYSYAEVKKHTKKINFQYELYEFIDNMPKIYEQTDFVISRSGASTIFELIYYKKPALLIPLPTAADNHQYFNAKFLQDSGVVELVEQKDFNKNILLQSIKKHIANDLVNKKMDLFKDLEYLVKEADIKIKRELCG